MNISNSSISYYQPSSTLKGQLISTSENETENTKTEGANKPPQGPPPQGPPPSKPTTEVSTDNSSDELSVYADYSSTELDVDSLLAEYDSDENSTLTENEIESLLKNNETKRTTPPRSQTPDEQISIMAQMQSTSSIDATTLNISDYITTDESQSSSLESTSESFNIEDYLSEDDDTEDTTLEITNINLQQKQQAQLAKAYTSTNFVNIEDSNVFYA